jgi:hypothetical protein
MKTSNHLDIFDSTDELNNRPAGDCQQGASQILGIRQRQVSLTPRFNGVVEGEIWGTTVSTVWRDGNRCSGL